MWSCIYINYLIKLRLSSKLKVSYSYIYIYSTHKIFKSIYKYFHARSTYNKRNQDSYCYCMIKN